MAITLIWHTANAARLTLKRKYDMFNGVRESAFVVNLHLEKATVANRAFSSVVVPAQVPTIIVGTECAILLKRSTGKRSHFMLCGDTSLCRY